MTCICGHPYADHQMHWTPATGDNWAGICDLCDCPQYVPDEALAAVDAHEPLAPHRLPLPASPTGAGQGPGGGAL